MIRTHLSADPAESFGWAAARIGDLDGDGAPEYLISAIFNAQNGFNAGRVVLYSGADGSVMNEVFGNPGDRLGHQLASAGDVNGDGVLDYALGGPGSVPAPGPQPGRLLVLSGADHSVLLDVAGPGDRTFFGYDVHAAGDLNGDGFDDLVVGAPRDSTSFAFAGRAYAISGRDGSTLWTYGGEQGFYLVGTGVAGIGDLNGDGIPEQVAAGFQAGHKFQGEGYVLSGADGTVLHVLKPKNEPRQNFGNFFVQNAGDTDRDGVDDILIGDFGIPSTPGRAYLWSGADTEARQILDGANAADGFGIGRGVGDVDGDGHADLFLAAFHNSEGAFQAGKGYVYSGRNLKRIREMTGTVAGAQLGFDALGLGDVNADGRIDFMLTGVGVAHVIAGNPVP
ncbi:MAG TPA: integrin alpha [Candidatus Polarisedimenticolaceae bacterium]|nr:integrin alpha [Candidatus Polarisedimenticolaceae bacterium]